MSTRDEELAEYELACVRQLQIGKALADKYGLDVVSAVMLRANATAMALAGMPMENVRAHVQSLARHGAEVALETFGGKG